MNITKAWKDLNIAKKIWVGFGLLLLLLGGVICLCFNGIGSLVESSQETNYGNILNTRILEVEVAHLNWAGKVKALITDEEIQTLDVQTDDHRCMMGKWLYSKERKVAEEKFEGLAEILKEIEEPHYHLHKSAVSVKEAFHPEDTKAIQKAHNIYKSETEPNLTRVRSLLADVRHKIKVKVDGLNKQFDTDAHQAQSNVGLIGLLGIVLGVVLAYLIAQGIVSPLKNMVERFKDIAEGEGDLTQRLEVASADETGQLALYFNQFVSKIRDSVSVFANTCENLTNSSEELAVVSRQLSANAEESACQANVVSSASEEVSKSVHTVASGVEEMSASIKEISENATQAARVANNAVTIAGLTNKTVAKLSDSSSEIGNIIKVISSIAEQTNLLALNATIEAARAGEAGKGFAVVANEVKELAKETAKATEEIASKIEAIQNDSHESVDAIGKIETVINQINDISNIIASAVEEQTVTTNEISRNISEAAQGTGEISHNVTNVAEAANNTSSGATQLQSSSGELSRMAVELKRVVSGFKY